MRQTTPQIPPTCETTMIWGTEDRLITMRQAAILRKWLGNPPFILIEGAGHMPQIEQPEAFAEAVKKLREAK